MFRRRSATQRLAESAGFTWKHVGDQSELNVAQMVAYVAANRSMADDVLPMVASVAEKLAGDEANHDLVLAMVEDLQNLTSHGLPQLHAADDVVAVLGPRCRIYWEAAAVFWEAVARWRAGTGEPLRSVADILLVENEQLRANLWTSNRSLGDDTRVGLSDAILFEKAGGALIPGYRELMGQ